MTEGVRSYGSRENATSGHSGGATSKERVLTEDANGTNGKRQGEALRLLDYWGFDGLTVWELRHETAFHHGQASAALSNLHKAGLIARLTTRRGRCFVYVMPDKIDGRETSEYGSRCKASGLTETETLQLEGATRAVEELGMGLPLWRAQHLISIIKRLTK